MAAAGAPKGAAKKAQGPVQPVAHQPVQQAPTPAPVEDNGDQATVLAESIVSGFITATGDAGFTAKDADGGFAEIGKKAAMAYMKATQKDAAGYPSNLRRRSSSSARIRTG